MIRLSRVFAAAGLLILSLARAVALGPQVHHPLDGLTPDEYWKIYDVLRDAGKVTEKTRFPSILLREPDKSVVLAWRPGQPIPRKADVVLFDDGKSFAAVVDIASGKLDFYTELKGAQARAGGGDLDDLIKKDPRVAEALKQRGITDLHMVNCHAAPTGYLGLTEQTDGHRIAIGGCIYAEGISYGEAANDIAGMIVIVDLNEKKVLRVTDYGAVPKPANSYYFDADGGAPLPGTKPFLIAQPEGPSFTVDSGEITWQNWQFRFRLDPRVGPVINLITWNDGGKRRSVLYEGSLSELYVPYMDPEEPENSRVFLDAGEYFHASGSGGILKPLLAGVDCPSYATFFSATFFRENAMPPYNRARIACLFERVTGDPMWRHWVDETYGRPSRELVFRTVATVGNYDYLMDWRFEQDGTIVVGVGATGALEVKEVKDQRADAPPSDKIAGKDPDGHDVQFGQLVFPGVDGVNHDHFFSFRLDLDVDGPKNSLMVDHLVPYKLPDSAPGRKYIWAMQPEMVKTECDAKLDVSLQHPSMWRFVNDGVKNSLGQSSSFEIMPGETAISLLPSSEWVQKRAGFSEHTLWVTPYDPSERYASGVYVLGTKGEDSLPAWTEKNRSIMNTDIVAWYTVGFHHVPRPEDWPQMPVMWHTFSLRPFQFLNRNPTMDLPMTP